jgi:hypothetical protein
MFFYKLLRFFIRIIQTSITGATSTLNLMFSSLVKDFEGVISKASEGLATGV